MEDIWTIKAALEWTVGYLERSMCENPRLSAEWLLASACKMRRVELYVNYERPLSQLERDLFRDYIKRRVAGEPLQYITGEVGFRHISLKVSQGVLIPRPETEVLVSEALALLPAPDRVCALDSRISETGEFLDRKEPVKGEFLDGEVLVEDTNANADTTDTTDATNKASTNREDTTLLVADIGTGSGCIACSLAYEHPRVHVIATDISPAALKLARENVSALNLGSRIEVLESDLGENVPAQLLGTFDLVVSNPPYIPHAQLAEIPGEVTNFEPALALDGGEDGLVIYRRLLLWCMRALKPGAAFAFELHEDTLEIAAHEALQAGFSDVGIVNDLAGRARVLIAKKP